MFSFLIKNIELSGIVCKKNRDSIWIVPDNPICISSNDCKVGCGSCSYAKNKKRIRICVEDISQIANGDRVSISTIQLNEAFAAAIMFGLPIFLMLLSLFLWYILKPTDLNSPKVILSSFLAFIIGFVIVKEIDFFLRKKFPVRADNIRKVLDKKKLK